MSELDVKGLEANFEGWRTTRAAHLKPAEAFERFVAEQVLKDYELSDEEIASGIIGNSDDGGVDGMYFFINSTLIQEETELPDPAVVADLYIIQAKGGKGEFSEGVIEKMQQFTQDLLTYSTPVDSVTYLNSEAKDAITLFRDRYNEILGSKHTLNIRFHYARAKADAEPGTKVVTKVGKLKAFVNTQITAASVTFQFWPASELLKAARSQPNRKLMLGINKHFMTSDRSAVCLSNIRQFSDFLRDKNGDLRRHLFEPNVRDYQGKRNEVNADIRQALKEADVKEFWWLNNGITILAKDCSVAGDVLVIDHPEIVNGLQTSTEVFEFFAENPEHQDNRNILVRVVLPPDQVTRNKITKATNFQTPVNPVSLHATDPIHFDIEDKLKLYEVFYDRRKGEYRNLGKPIRDIVSIKHLATVIIAIVLRQPDSARARPQSLLLRPEEYGRIFNDGYNRDVYVVSVFIDRQVHVLLAADEDLDKDQRRNIRYYVDLCVAAALTKRAKPTTAELAKVLPDVVRPIPPDVLANAIVDVQEIYEELGESDQAAKSQGMRDAVLEYLDKKYV